MNRIRKRFGDSQIYLCSDRVDLPRKLKLNLNYAREPEALLSISAGAIPVICAFESDQRLVDTLSILKRSDRIYYYCLTRGLPVARYFHRNDLAKKVLLSESSRRRGKFDLPDFEHIIQALDITSGIDGSYVEIGVYKGDSALIALEYMKSTGQTRNSFFLDVFEGFTGNNPESSNDAFWLDSHTDTSLEYVSGLLSPYAGAEIIKTDIIQDQLPDAINPVAVCNIDVDIYEATLACLTKAAARMAKNGIMICEDAGHTPFLGGAYLAVSEFMKSEQGRDFIPLNLLSGQMFFIRK